jgi:hypothetical protein
MGIIGRMYSVLANGGIVMMIKVGLGLNLQEQGLMIVTPTSLGAVLGQKAYMLFYVKRSLAYVQPAPRLTTNGSTSTVANGTGNGSVNGH